MAPQVLKKKIALLFTYRKIVIIFKSVELEIIHPEKTVCMLFHHPRHHPPDLNIFLNNHAITQVHQHKHLGVILSSTLSWSPHVEHLISRSSAMLGLLRHLLSYFHFSSRCLLKVYLCYIRPLLEYGCSSFVGLSVRSARQLEAVQQKALSICSVDSDCYPFPFWTP